MTTMGMNPQTTSTGDGPDGAARGSSATRPTLLDLSVVNLADRSRPKADIERWIPHRGAMCLLDCVPWVSEDGGSGVALWEVKADEFWVPGHFPGRPMLPGVLQIEAGAQLSVYLHNRRSGVMQTAAFTHIRDASFRAPAQPGDELVVMAKELRYHPRRFTSDIQGMVAGRIIFEATIEGISLR